MSKKRKENVIKNNQEDVEKIWNDYFEPNNIIFIAGDHVVTAEISSFVSQPADGILYDLGLLPENSHTLAKSDIIDMAEYIDKMSYAKIIKYLKNRVDELEKTLQEKQV